MTRVPRARRRTEYIRGFGPEVNGLKGLEFWLTNSIGSRTTNCQVIILEGVRVVPWSTLVWSCVFLLFSQAFSGLALIPRFPVLRHRARAGTHSRIDRTKEAADKHKNNAETGKFKHQWPNWLGAASIAT